MKTNLRYFSFIITSILLILMGCTVTRHIKPQEYGLDPRVLKPLRGNVPIKVLVPENAERNYRMENNKQKNVNLYIDLNDLYKHAKELMEETLVRYKVPLSPDAEKYIKFRISKVEWGLWGGGFLAGAFLEFDIETGDGYKQHYKVQDQSAQNWERSVGATTSRAVEKIFQDEKIIAYIESQ